MLTIHVTYIVDFLDGMDVFYKRKPNNTPYFTHKYSIFTTYSNFAPNMGYVALKFANSKNKARTLYRKQVET